jgi:hypothetical protein
MSSCTPQAALLTAAAQTRFYRPWLRGTPRSIEAWVRDRPLVTLHDLYEHRAAFRNEQSAVSPAEFRYPLQPAPNCVVFAGGFRSTGAVAVIPEWRDAELASIAGTKAIAAPISVLRVLAESKCERLYPVTAFTGPCHGVLFDSDRDRIWDAFGVPVFEQFLGVRNELLAEDCDAHDGLHIRGERARFDSHGCELTVTSFANLAYPVLRLATGLHGRIEASVCACGRSGLKLLDLSPLPRTLAAIA